MISPSILSADFANLTPQLEALQEAGIKKIHLDVMDGHFVPNLSFGVPVIKSLTAKFGFRWDAHLMVQDPEPLLASFARSGIDHITLHQEACKDPAKALDQIHQLGLTAGLAINPDTPINVLEPYWDKLDLILVMSVHPGFGGQSFIDSSLQKLEALSQKIKMNGRKMILQIDGGINLDTAARVKKAGANDFVIGSALLNLDIKDYKPFIEAFNAA